MWFDGLAIGLLCLFALIGAIRGGFTTGMSLLALTMGYAAALLGGSALTPAFASRLAVPALVAAPLAGTAVFFAGYGAIALLAFVLRRRLGIGDEPPGPAERWIGAALGVVRGALVVALLGVLALWIDALRAAGTPVPMPPVADSRAARASGDLVELGMQSALADTGAAGRVAAHVAGHPAQALEAWQAVLAEPAVLALRQDAAFWTYVEQGQVDAALAREGPRRLLGDAALRERLAALGLTSEAGAANPEVFRSELAAVLREVGARIRNLRRDPAVEALVRDPQVVAMIQSGDTMGLLEHPGFRALVERITAQGSTTAAALR
jgi:uncharacterized membrane protein required for colicin V production